MCCPRPAARGDCLFDLLVTSHSSQEVQNFRPGDGHFAQIHSQACLALDAPRLVVERGCASWLAAKSGHDLGPAKKWGRRTKIALGILHKSTVKPVWRLTHRDLLLKEVVPRGLPRKAAMIWGRRKSGDAGRKSHCAWPKVRPKSEESKMRRKRRSQGSRDIPRHR